MRARARVVIAAAVVFAGAVSMAHAAWSAEPPAGGASAQPIEAAASSIAALASDDEAARRVAEAALADAGTPDDARALVAVGAKASYATRAAVTRALVAMDDRAVAALVVAKRGKDYGARGWAAATLESMRKERADAQIRTRSDDVLAGILHAFGEVRDPDALGVIASFFGSERAKIRDAARAALVDYGTDALPKLRQDYADLTGQPAPAAWDADRTAHELFAASDRLRLREVYALLDEGLARARAGDLDAAVRAFDAVLARQPDLDRRGEIVPSYVDHALALQDRDPLAARAYLEKAYRLAPDSARTGAIESALATLDGEALAARGAPDPEIFRRALILDPANPRARAALDRMEAAEVARQATVRRWEAIAAALAAMLVAVLLFVGRRERGRR